MAIIVGGVMEKEGKFLLVQEAKEKCRGKWNIPAGHLDPNETIFEGAKREIFEETGCAVELTGLLSISNRVLEDDVFLGLTFSTKIVNEDIKFDTNEILDVKWFSYNEIVNMRNELRDYDWITNAVKAYKDNKIIDLAIINII